MIFLQEEILQGVDFSRIFDSGADANDDVIQVELFDPQGEQLLGTLAAKPPNGLVYILPPEDELFVSRLAPSNYTVQVTLVDKVGNVSNESFSFEVDNTDINHHRSKLQYPGTRY